MKMEQGSLYLTSMGFTYDLFHPEDHAKIYELRHEDPARRNRDVKVRKHAVHLQFLNTVSAPVFKEDQPRPYYYNYFLGNDPSKWVTGIRPVNKVTYQDVLPGVNLEFIAGNQAKYQWVLNDPSPAILRNIKMQVSGHDSLTIDDGHLVIHTTVGVIREDAPVAYQLINGKQVEIDAYFYIEGDIIGIRLKDESQVVWGHPLVLDPKLIFSTYSGSIGDNFGYTATYDSRGNLYAGGIVDFQGPYPATSGAYMTTWQGGVGRSPVNLACDISISKYDSAGKNLLWATYIGGQDDEYPHSLVVDNNDDLLILGTTHSNNYPTSDSAFDKSYNGMFDIVVTKFSEDGLKLLGSTYVGGTSDDGLVDASSPLKHNYADNFRGDIITDDSLNIFIASSTNSNNMPTATPNQGSLKGVKDAFLMQLNPNLSDMLWGTYFGGSGRDASYSIKLDEDNIYVAGGTTSDDLQTSDTAIQKQKEGGVDGFICRFDKTNKTLKDLTYYGTSSYDQIYFIDIDNEGFVYATGQTEGAISKSSGVYGSDNKGQFIFKVDTALSQLFWQTTFGNTDQQINLAPSAFMVDFCQHIYFSGWGSDISNFLPHPGSTTGMEVTSDAEQSTTDDNDFYILVLDKDATSLLYATYFGGDSTADHVDGGTSRFDKQGVIYQSVCSSCPGYGSIAVNNTEINDFPVTPDAAFTYNSSVRCSNASFKIDLQIESAVVADFIARPNIGCGPINVKFTNRSLLGDSLIWDFGDGSFSSDTNPEHLYNDPGIYIVTLTIIDSNTCNISDIIEKFVIVIDQGNADFELDYKSCTNELTITNKSEGAVTYLWDFGDDSTSTDETPEHEYLEEGTYTIRLVVNPESLCADTFTQVVDVSFVSQGPFKLYNVFTPNNDQKNDCFRFDGLDQVCDGIEWEVYNRWGELLFETTDPEACWNGNLPDGTPLPEGTYFWILDLDPESHSADDLISGTVDLLR